MGIAFNAKRESLCHPRSDGCIGPFAPSIFSVEGKGVKRRGKGGKRQNDDAAASYRHLGRRRTAFNITLLGLNEAARMRQERGRRLLSA